MPDRPSLVDDQRFGELPVVKALFGGAFAGALQVALYYGLAGALIAKPVGRPEQGPLESLLISLPAILFLVFPIAFVVWLIGLAFLGAPGWWLMHRLRLRSLAFAAPYGFGLTFGVGVLLSGGQVFLTNFLFGAAGATVAATIWFLAYRSRQGAATT